MLNISSVDAEHAATSDSESSDAPQLQSQKSKGLSLTDTLQIQTTFTLHIAGVYTAPRLLWFDAVHPGKPRRSLVLRVRNDYEFAIYVDPERTLCEHHALAVTFQRPDGMMTLPPKSTTAIAHVYIEP